MNAITTQDLTKIYRTGMRKGDITALDQVSVQVEAGEIFALLGPNGAGKTTFLKVVLGLVRPTSGSATIGDLPPSDPRSRDKAGYLPENHAFPQWHTGLGLLELAGRLHGMSAATLRQRADYLLVLVGMERWAKTKIRKYSKGMLQRIGLAQAMISDPDLLLLDEPTDGVDPVGRVEIREVLKRIRGEGKTIILNSHLLAEVEAVADRVAILHRGHLLRVSSVAQLTSRQSQYEIEAEIGSRILELPEEVGKIVATTAHGLLVELKDPENVNGVIDLLRANRISIRSIKPLKVSLEQSFVEAVSERIEEFK